MRSVGQRTTPVLGQLLAGSLGLLAVAAAMGGCLLERQGALGQQCTSDAECDDGNRCAPGRCDEGGLCQYTPAPDGVAPQQLSGDCERVDCVAGASVSVVDPRDPPPDEGDPCTTGQCTDAGPVQVPIADGNGCIDGAGDLGLCFAHVCVVECTATSTEACDDAEVCTEDTCSLMTGQCLNTSLSGVVAPEQVTADCKLVVCADGTSQATIDNSDVSDDGNPCTADLCESGVARSVPFDSGAPCDVDGGRMCNGDPLDPACVECVAPADCPGVVGLCRGPTCASGLCGDDFALAGTALGPQTAGDCLLGVCDGTGASTIIVDSSDVPDDHNECTVDSCTGDQPGHEPAPAGTACGTASPALACDDAGNCIGCALPVDCGVPTDCITWDCTAGTCEPLYVAADTPLPVQVDADCLELQCNGIGGVNAVVFDTDLPADDGNDCTREACLDGNGVHPARPLNDPCGSENLQFCDGAGNCVECNAARQCPTPAGVCRQAACINHVCGATDTPAGVPAEVQVPGDCHLRICDGSGGSTSQVDDADVPVDGNDCTQDLCSGGTPSNVLEAEGTPCGATDSWACDAAGRCIECVNDDECTAPDVCNVGTGRCVCDPLPCSRCGNEWVHGYGDGTLDQFAEAVATGSLDTLAVAGRFKGTVDFGAGPVPGHSNKYDGFAAVYDAAGSARWVRAFGDGSQDQFAMGVAVSSDGGVVVTGRFRGAVNFGGGTVSSAGGKHDVFVARYGAGGSLEWVKTLGNGAQDQFGESVAVDTAGNVMVTGRIKAPVDFGDGVPIGHSAKYDLFVASYGNDGAYRWARAIGNDDQDQRGQSVAVDGAGNVVVTGRVKEPVDFGDGVPIGHSAKFDLFVASYDNGGAYRWARTIGNDAQDQFGESVAVDGVGNVVVTGRVKEPVDFGDGVPIGHSTKYDLFVASYDGGGAYRWAKVFGNDVQDQFGESAAVDGAGNVVVTGRIKAPVDFGSGVPIGHSAKYDIFAAMFDGAGVHLCSKAYGDDLADQRGEAVAALGVEQFVLTGRFEGAVDFGAGPIVSHGAATDVFLARFGP